ncbi:PREDICTED: probable C-mannosyltransferase DPY19L4 [Thamnophis sirtalis]|uniref:Probable C-mannosyltransferase DPY19L4 n=1 Tax=Thamnophis sirtalis TaxID=35019 RepID=A0A6I9YLV5_9SAUR|nr:PREDICTED: probable C-mannosyltransferase DPY19L4 [Thamnophis sirtalis]
MEEAVELRQRKNASCTEVEEKTLKENNEKGKQSKRSLRYVLIPHFTKLFFGCITAIISGMMYAIYLSTYHERKFWFSGRPELEREITFQGDSAIYYSFYKELLKASSFKKGIHQLIHDNRTLSLKTMNTVRQMTLYPELIASILYQASGSESCNSVTGVKRMLSICSMSFLFQRFISHKENEHLIKVLEVKLGLNTNKNFTVNWLLCQESLQTPSQDFFLRLTHSSLLPFYLLVLIICLASVGQASFRKMGNKQVNEQTTNEGGINEPTTHEGRIGERPEVAYHILHTVSLGLLSMMMEGMKYVWTPYVCMIAAFGVCSPELWTTLFKWIRLKTVHPVLLGLILSMAVPGIIGFSLWKEFFPRIMAELSELQEFYDPDTVGLMTWIKRQAPIAAVFAGSPQLMGAIRLCTGWMVTNLPLYNDDDLQKRNENIFQIYSKRSAEDIYKILTSYKATYLVIEDSICNEVGPVRGCRVKDLLDIANGHVYYEENDSSGYSKYGRFCQEIKMNYSPYVNYFTRVYWNRSYLVYKINSIISFQS